MNESESEENKNENRRDDESKKEDKMRATKQQLHERAEQCARDSGILQLALNDVLNGKVKWFRNGAHKLGVSRVCGAEGGIVIHTYRAKGQSDYSCAYYWEQWFSGIRWLDSRDVEAITLRECAFAAQEYIMREQSLGFNHAGGATQR